MILMFIKEFTRGEKAVRKCSRMEAAVKELQVKN